MRIKIDENIPARVANILRQFGHETDTVPQQGLTGQDDVRIWEAAQVKDEYIMPIISLSAHFDGKQICLDEPFDLKPDAKLIVTVLPERESDDEHRAWLTLSGQRLEEAYGENEPEYSSDLVKEVNPHYESR